jgi:geranylgeranyl pyrophosphate synthase
MNGLSPTKLIDDELHEVEAIMRQPLKDQQIELEKAVNYLLDSGGKRIRPLICLLVGNILGVDRTKLVKLAAAIEILHTATLVHDDLIDGSLLRRGIPTLNSKWSPGATVLTGDFFFAKSASLAAETESIPVINLFAQTVATLVNGEVDQMFAKPCAVNTEGYFNRIYAKTASLFETSAMAPALLEEKDELFTKAFQKYGMNVGMAFQVIDDILDFTGKQSNTGKPAGIDIRAGLVTLPVIYFVEQNPNDPIAKNMAEGKCPKSDETIINVIQAIQNSSSMDLAFKDAENFVQKAKKSLNYVPDCVEKTALLELASFITQRTL